MMNKHTQRILRATIVILVLLLASVIFLLLTDKNKTETKYDQLPWYLTLVNKTHPVPKTYIPELCKLANGEQIDRRIYPELQEMFDEARANGLDLQAAHCYRTKQQQADILQSRVNEIVKQGYSEEQAIAEAQLTVALPDHSEHQLGLAIDIQKKGNTNADQLYAWLENNAYRYGFILRYPKNKTEETGFQYERWHYRYVGTDAAQLIQEEQLTLEEYLQIYE